MENLPSHLFEMLGEKNFNELSAQQKTEILKHLSENDYNQLREATLIGQSFVFNAEELSINTSKEELLMQQLKNKNKKTLFINKPIALWKAAAVFLLFGLLSYFYTNFKNINPNQQYANLVDTVYISKETIVERLIDTIYLTHKHETKLDEAKKYIPKNFKKQEFASTLQQIETVKNPSPLNILSVKDFENQPNKNKKGSIKYDSLIYQIGFVTM